MPILTGKRKDWSQETVDVGHVHLKRRGKVVSIEVDMGDEYAAQVYYEQVRDSLKAGDSVTFEGEREA